MERIFKRHFWIVHFAFIFGASILIAGTANAFVQSALLPSPTERPTRRVASPPSEAMALLDAARLSAFTGLRLQMPAGLTPPTELAAPINAPPARSALRLRLLGTLISGSPEYSVAAIQDCLTLKSQTLMIGDSVQGARAVEIERGRAIILNRLHREFLDGTCGEGGGAAVAPQGNSASPPSVVLGATIRQTGENLYDFPRAELEKTLANLSRLAMEGRIVPAFTGGVATGFKLFSIRPDSLYTKIGIQDGDIIKRINGYALDSPERGLELYSKLRDAARIDIELERNGSSIRKTYDVR